MTYLLAISRGIDRLLSTIAKVGMIAGIVLVLVVVFDVTTRKAGLNKEDLVGLNSTQVQESEFWLHTVFFSLVIGYAYTKQAHVRIDLVRARFSYKVKCALELFGCLLFLLPCSVFMVRAHYNYALTSFQENEISNSLTGLNNIWVHKSCLVVLFALLTLAGVSQALKSLLGLTGHLPASMIRETLADDA